MPQSGTAQVEELKQQIRENRLGPPDGELTVASAAVEGYIAQHQLQYNAARKLRSLAPELQELVMQKDVSYARSVSAVVCSLTKQAQDPNGVEVLKRDLAKEANYDAADRRDRAGARSQRDSKMTLN